MRICVKVISGLPRHYAMILWMTSRDRFGLLADGLIWVAVKELTLGYHMSYSLNSLKGVI